MRVHDSVRAHGRAPLRTPEWLPAPHVTVHLLLAAVIATGCATGPGELPLSPARLVLLRRELRDRPHTQTDLGWLDLLYGDGQLAMGHFQRASAQWPNALALLGRATILAQRGLTREQADAWLDLLAHCQSSREETCGMALPLALDRLWRLDAGRPVRLRGLLSPLTRDVSPIVRQMALRLLTRLARRTGSTRLVRQLTRQRRCPATWEVSGPHHRNAHVDLDLSVPPAPSPRRVTARECTVHLRSAARWGGVYWLRTVPGWSGPVTLMVQSASPWQMLVGGRRVWSHAGATAARRVLLRLSWPRGAELGLKVGSPTGYSEVTVSMTPSRTAGRSVAQLPCVVVSKMPARWYAPLWRYLAAAQAVSCGAWNSARRDLALARSWAPRFTAPRLLAARVLLADDTLPAAVSGEEVIRLLRSMVKEGDGGCGAAMLMLAHQLLRRGEEEPALKILRLGARRWPAEVSWQEGLHRAHREQSHANEEQQALRRAVELAPWRCELMEQLATVMRQRKDVQGMLHWAISHRRCDASSPLLARFLRRAGRLEQAAREYRRILSLRPEAYLQRELVQVLHLLGRDADARRLLQQVIDEYPASVEDRVEMADLLLARGQRAAALDLLRRLHRRTPWEADLRRTLQQVSGVSVMQSHRVDGLGVIASYTSEHAAGELPPGSAPAVVVQDRLVTRFFPNGSSVSLTHNIVEVLTKQGIERWGEVALPPGADLLTLRTIKADGTIREPEDLVGKTSILLPGLERGDFVEMEYVDAVAPPRAFDGIQGPRFFFGSFEVPLWRSEYTVIVPPGLQMQVDRRGDVPLARRSTSAAGETLLRWAVQHRPRVMAEPSSVQPQEYMPSVRVRAGADWSRWHDYYMEQVVQATKPTWRIARLVSRVVRKMAGPRARAEALYDWTLKQIEPAGPTLGSASEAVSSGRGSRHTVLLTLLKQAGFAAEMWLVRPVTAAGGTDASVPEIEGFTRLLVRCVVGGTTFLLQPDGSHVPFGYVAPELRGALAIPLTPHGAQSHFARSAPHSSEAPPLRAQPIARVPRAVPGSADSRRVDLRVQVAADGNAEVSAVERVQGLGAQEWRQQLEQIDRSRLAPLFEQQYLGVNVPGGSLQRLTLEGERGRGPLYLRYRFRVPNLCRRDRAGLRCGLGLFAPRLGPRYLGLARRHTPLQLGFHPPTSVAIELAAPRGYRVVDDVRPLRVASEFGRLEREVRYDPAMVEVRHTFRMDRWRIAPRRYREFARFAKRVDLASDVQVVLELEPRSAVKR